MIFGSCPYCDNSFAHGLPDGDLPCFAQNTCEHCHKIFWTKYSRVDPQSWTEEDFRHEFEIDEEQHRIQRKEPL